jgi:ribonuclease M5
MKIKIDQIVLVEGRYDKIKLDSILEATVIAVNGFGLFKDEEKKATVRALAKKCGAIILCDSDGGGTVIRRHLNSILPKESRINLYIPEIMGKERRKIAPSKEGKLGVEGMEAELLRNLFLPFASGEMSKPRADITAADLFADGFSGTENSSEKRAELAKALGLPSNISSKLLVDAVNILGGREVYEDTKNGLRVSP